MEKDFVGAFDGTIRESGRLEGVFHGVLSGLGSIETGVGMSCT